MNGQDDANDIVDELLQRELNPIVDQQLQELGFIDLCKKIAQKVVDRVKTIDEEHQIIKATYAEIENKLDALLEEQERELLVARSKTPVSASFTPSSIESSADISGRQSSGRSSSGRASDNNTDSSRLGSTPKKNDKAIIVIDDDEDEISAATSIASSTTSSTNNIAPVQTTIDDSLSLARLATQSSMHNTTSSTTLTPEAVPENALSVVSASRENETVNLMTDASLSVPTANRTEIQITDPILNSDTVSQAVSITSVTSNSSIFQQTPISSKERVPSSQDSSIHSTPDSVAVQIISEGIAESALSTLQIDMPSTSPGLNILGTEMMNDPSMVIDVPSPGLQTVSIVDTISGLSPLQTKSPFTIGVDSLSSVSPNIYERENTSLLTGTSSVDSQGSFLSSSQESSLSERRDAPTLLVDSGVNNKNTMVDGPNLQSAMSANLDSELDQKHANKECLQSPIILETNTVPGNLTTKIKLPSTSSDTGASLLMTTVTSKKPTPLKKGGPKPMYTPGMSVLVKPDQSTDLWYSAEITKKLVTARGKIKFNVRFVSGQKLQKTVPVSHISPMTIPEAGDLEIGSRVVAGRPSDTVEATISKKYKDIVAGTQANVMFAGVVCELACEQNRDRYLVIFDDGYAQYLPLKRLHQVLFPATNVWEDVSYNCQEFIKEYLQDYPNRPMVRTKVGDKMKTEWDGKWWRARVISVDCSLVKMIFDIDKRSEWIYLGTTRLEPMALEFGLDIGPVKKHQGKDRPYVDKRITHPNFGVSKYSNTDPEGKQQRKEWEIASPRPEPQIFEIPDEPTVSLESSQQKQELPEKDIALSKTKSPTLSPSSLKTTAQPEASTTTSVQELHKSAEFKLKQLKDTENKKRKSSISGSDSDKDHPKQKAPPSLLLKTFGGSSSDAEKSSAKEADLQAKSWEAPWLKKRKRPSPAAETHTIRTSSKDILECQPPIKKQARKSVASTLVEKLQRGMDTDDEIETLPSPDPLFIPTNLPPLPMKRGPHKCSPTCLPVVNLPSQQKRTENYMVIPLLRGWMRECSKRRPGYHKDTYYRTPCSKRLKNLLEVTKYLLETKATNVNIDMFSFDPQISCRIEPPKTREPKARIADLSYGKETVRIECLNDVNTDLPPAVEYVATRIVAEGVNINTDPGFLSCCDCTDNCQDKSKCKCAQLTIESSNAIDGVKKEKSGYHYRRLKECITSGIYECNQNCACGLTCYNRVAQNGIQLRLQVFMTASKGWGLRCKDDIPKGSFVCTYAGQILTEDMANKEGMDFGDEYLAELDHLEVVEKHKEGYESDVPELRNVADDSADSDDDSISCYTVSNSSSSSSDDDDDVVEEFFPAIKKQISSDSDDSDINAPKRNIDMKRNIIFSGESTPSTPPESASFTMPNAAVTPESDLSTPPPLPDPGDLKSCSVQLQRLASVDLPSRLDSTSDSVTDDSFMEGLDDDSSGSSLPPAFTPSKKKPVLDTSVTLETSVSAAIESAVSEALESAVLEATKPKLSDIFDMKNGTETADSDNDKALAADSDNDKAPVSTSLSDLPLLTSEKEPSNILNVSTEPSSKGSIISHVTTTSDAVDRLVISTSVVDKPVITGVVSVTEIAVDPMLVSPTSISSDQKQNTFQTPIIPSIARPVKAMARKSTGPPLINSQIKPRAFAIKSTGGMFYSSPRSSTGGHQLKQQQNISPLAADEGKSSTRILYGDKQSYVIDAKSYGNVGRYLNHSCSPNLFVQNVFVDTHDLRFPWVSFFTQTNIPAFTELTWDYSYEVGSVKDKVLTCHCGAAECRGRLL